MKAVLLSKIKGFSIIVLSFIIVNVHAQIRQKGSPASFENRTSTEVPLIKLEERNFDILLEEDDANEANKILPYRFGTIIDTAISPQTHGTWIEKKGDNKIWIVAINSPGALSMGVIFDEFNLKENEKIFLYNNTKEKVLGAYTSENNAEEDIFVTEQLAGDLIYLEYNSSGAQFSFPDIRVQSIVHDYKGLQNMLKSSGSCNINVNCPPGNKWQTEKRAVCKYTFASGPYSYLCTGALVNNTSNNGTPYFLTANHCVGSSTEASSMVLYFNYESASCIGSTGPTTQTLSGSTLKATASNLDFCLVEMNSTPPLTYNPYYAGWNANTTAPQMSVCIHHPSGDIKKISLDFNPATTSSYTGYTSNTHWQVIWDMGTTEGGSSGSPLFDKQHRIIGTLTGGLASCSYLLGPDYYAKFDKSYNYNSSSTQQLKYWLDPANSGISTLDGYDPNNPPDPYEDNNTPQTAYVFNTINFTNDTAVIQTTSSTLHTLIDRDNYQILLPPGYDYYVSTMVHDAVYSTDGNSYSSDVRYRLRAKSTGSAPTITSWADTSLSVVSLANGGRIDLNVGRSQVLTGSYLLEIIVARDTASGSTKNILSGNEIINTEDIIISPNPAKSLISVQTNTFLLDRITVNIYNTIGSLVYEGVYDAASTKLDINIESLEKGTYILEIQNSQFYTSRKFIKTE